MHVPVVNRRDPSELPSTAPIVIVGAGIVGIATALFLKRRGLDSIVVDAAAKMGSRTTSMSAHCIRAQFGEPDNIAMMTESLDFYEHFAERCGIDASIDLCQQGYLFASTEPGDEHVFRNRIETQRRAGLDDVELLSGDDVRHRFPWLSQEIAVATYRARDGWIDSQLALEAMAAAAGVPVYLGVHVSRFEIQTDQVAGVDTSAGSVSTEMVVVAAGPFSRDLSPEPLPMALWRRHRVIVAPDPGIPQTGPVTIDANTGAHWRPHNGGALLAWAQPETDSVACWPVRPDPAFTDLVLRSADGVGRIAPFWRGLASRLGAQHVTLTAGQYTMTPDHRPLIGAAPVTRGLFLNTGYSGHGVMGAPAGARLLADVMTGSVDVANPFRPTRFEGHIAPPDIEQVVI